MPGIKAFYKDNQNIKTVSSLDEIRALPKESILWIDLNDASDETEDGIEAFLKIYIQEDKEMEEIELSSRYMETEDSLVLNSNYLSADYQEETVSFIVKNNILVTVRNREHRSFTEVTKSIVSSPRKYQTNFHILTALLAMRVDFDADMIEEMSRDITKLSAQLKDQSVNDDILIAITDLQDKTMMIREHIIDRHRVCSNLNKSSLMPAEFKEKVSILINDINSLIEYTSFSFARLEYLQDTFLGMVNLQQNRIIKIFTVVSVVFLPPTLIASIYGMNFDFMPELHWQLGYLFAILMMLLCVVAILVIFKRKKWM